MSDGQSFGGGNFFEGMLGDLLKMVRTDAPMQWEIAVQFATSVASDNSREENPDPMERIRLEQLLAIAELHVADVTGMVISPSGAPAAIATVTRSEWAHRSLESWRPVIEAIATALRPPSEPDAVVAEDDEGNQGDLGALMGKWATAISPMMLSMQIGSVVGHLSRRVLSQYELLLPRTDRTTIVLAPANLTQFSEDWSLSIEDLGLWVLARDLAIGSIFARAHVANRLFELLVRHAGGFRPDFAALQGQLDDSSLGDLGNLGGLDDLSKLLGNPAALRELADTPELAQTKRELAALNSTIDGYAEWVASSVVERVSGSSVRVREAMRRHRVEQGEQARTAHRLFGLSGDQEAFDRGEAFVRGVIERHGEHELARLWVVESDLPTPSEVEAPGLWLERVNLPDLDAES